MLYSVPDEYKEPYKGNPYPITLTFSDQLGRLKTLPFTPNQDSGPPESAYEQYTGSYSFLDLIHLCLDQIRPPDAGLFLYEGLDVFSSGMDQSDNTKSPLDQGYIDVEKYYDESGKPKMFHEVLSEAVQHFAAQMFAYKDGWIIRRVGSLDAAVVVRSWHEYLGSFTYTDNSSIDFRITNTVNSALPSVRLRMIGAHLDTLPALKKLVLNHDYGVRQSIIRNWSFTNNYETDHATAYTLPNGDGATWYSSVFANWINHTVSYICKTFLFNYQGDGIFSYDKIADGRRSNDTFNRRFATIQKPHDINLPSAGFDMGESGVLIIGGDGGYTSKCNDWTTGAYIDSELLTMNGPTSFNLSVDYMNWSNYVGGFQNGQFYIQVILYDLTHSWGQYTLDINGIWHSGIGHVILMPSPAVGGTSYTNFTLSTDFTPTALPNLRIGVRLFQMVDSLINWPTASTEWKGAVYDNIKVIPQLISRKGVTVTTRINNLNQKDQSVNLELGDAPANIFNSQLMYKNIVFEAGDYSVLSSAWDYKAGSTPLPHIEWLNGEYFKQLANASELISCKIHAGPGMFDFTKVIRDKDNGNKLFMIHRGTYNDLAGEFDGEIIRVFSDSDIAVIGTEDGKILITEDVKEIEA
jgi:hypothetical protein